MSFLKASEFQDGHAAYSDPIDEQNFLIKQINAIQGSQFWKDTAIFIAYDDSDGWYDHVDGKTVNGSNDVLNDTAECSTKVAKAAGGYQDRCGYGPRLPLLAISPYSKVNYIDHHTTEQASILRFVEDNWHTGRIGDASFDARAGSLASLFDFEHGRSAGKVTLSNKGAVTTSR